MPLLLVWLLERMACWYIDGEANWLRHKGVDDMANEIEVAFERLFKEEYEGKLAFAKDMDDKDGNYPLPRRL